MFNKRKFVIRKIKPEDKEWIRKTIRESWCSEIIVSRGKIHKADELPGFIVEDEKGSKLGLLTYEIKREKCELVSIDSLIRRIGVGTALIDRLKKEAKSKNCDSIWLIATNDNLYALGFYQKRGFRLVAIHRNAVDVARKIKPQIPKFGEDGIPLKDEVELETVL